MSASTRGTVPGHSPSGAARAVRLAGRDDVRSREPSQLVRTHTARDPTKDLLVADSYAWRSGWDCREIALELLEEHPPGQGAVEHLGQGELGLQDRDVVGVASVTVRWGERVRQQVEPLACQRVDLLGAELVADLSGRASR